MIYLFINYKRNRCATKQSKEDSPQKMSKHRQRQECRQRPHQQGAEPKDKRVHDGRALTLNGKAPPREEGLSAPEPAKNFLLTRLHKK